ALDFGDQFPGADRWLEIAVRTNLSGFTTLSPRQPLTATPYAITAENLSGALPAGQLSGTVPGANLGGTYSGAVTFDNAVNSFAGNGSGLTGLNAGALSSGTVPDGRLGANVARTNQVWLLGGNAGTTPGAQFVGTTDNQPLEFKVNGLRGLRLEPTINDAIHSNIVNVVMGSPANLVGSGVYGATIGGGGAAAFIDGFILSTGTNRVDADFGTIGGGVFNTIGTGDIAPTIGGGLKNTIQSSAYAATIGGGYLNTVETDSDVSTIGGGSQNTIASQAIVGTIGGGFANMIGSDNFGVAIGGGSYNRIESGGTESTIAGGTRNRIQSNTVQSTIGGGDANTIQAEGSASTIGGGVQNTIERDSFYSTIGGGTQNTIETNTTALTIGGGDNNHIMDGVFASSIGGGYLNTIRSNADYSTIPGGRENTVGIDAKHAFAAGRRAKANHTGAFVWADSELADFASTATNQFNVRASGGARIVGRGGFTNPQLLLQQTDTAGLARLRMGVSGSTDWDMVVTGGATPELRFFTAGGNRLSVQSDGDVFATSFNPTSDRAAKENFQPIDPEEVLNKVAALPLTMWNYKSDPDTRHLGPVAQDFHAAFGVGPDDKHIATVDADGVALAAIQGLNRKLEQKETEIAELKARLERLERLLE
ncbi:MAG TPA: hypothetical protein DCY13_00375, partial [Verrucomicrobiales bacterium]|nr:hypothetical protein [Verrucomicrobiales bacterium]